MNKYGFSSKLPRKEQLTEYLDYYNDGTKRNVNSYIISDGGSANQGSIMALIDKYNGGVLLRLNYDMLSHIGIDRINNEMEDSFENAEESIKLIDIPHTMNQLFPGKKLSFKAKQNNNLFHDKTTYTRHRNYDFFIQRYYTETIDNVEMTYESRLKTNDLFPIKEKFTEGFKKWVSELASEINGVESIDKTKFKSLRYLLNKTEGEMLYLTMNKSNISRINAIFNRINMDKVRETLETKSEMIEEMKGLMQDTRKMLKENWDSSTTKYGSLKPGANPEAALKVSMKGINFEIGRADIFINIAGESTKVWSQYWYDDKNKKVFDRALAYIISLGNEHELLQNKIEEKLLKAL